MSKRSSPRLATCLVAGLLVGMAGAPGALGVEGDEGARVRQAVDDAIKPVIAAHGIPGMAVAVTIDGRRHFVDYGLASKADRTAVTRNTLFELGSISKTFTATLATLAEADGKLTLNDSIGQHMPELKGTALGKVRLLELATHTAGGFPLQVPAGVQTEAQLTAYFRAWQPQFTAGTRRHYANPSIGLLGVAAARAMGDRYSLLAERRLFPELGLRHTYVDVPKSAMAAYAWGYNRQGKPVRVSPGPLAIEAYGVKSNAVDMIRFLEVNMGIGMGTVPAPVARAVRATHTGYYRTGTFIQDMIWEQYPYPADLAQMVAGNVPSAASNGMPVTAIEPPMAPRDDVIINKTGSTGGFGAYVAYIPAKKIGIVMLANTFYPNESRVKAAYEVLQRLAQ